jgi:hypothetical protein
LVGAGGGVVAGVVACLLVFAAALGAVLVGATVASCGGDAVEGLVAAVVSPCGGGELGVGEAGGAGDAAA